MRVIILLLLITLAYSAKLIQKVYPVGDNTCSGVAVYTTSEQGQDVDEQNGVEGCVNLDINPQDFIDDASVRNRWCDQNYNKYHVEIFPNINCNCGGGNCVREYPLDTCYLAGNVPTYTTCTDFNTDIGSLPTTILYIDQRIDNSTNITHVTNVTNITVVTNVTEEHHHNDYNTNVTHYDAPDLDQNTITVIAISGSLVLIAAIGAGVYIWFTNKKEKATNAGETPLLKQRQKRTFSNNIL